MKHMLIIFKAVKSPFVLKKMEGTRGQGAMRAILGGMGGVYIITATIKGKGKDGVVINDTHALTINAFNRSIFDNTYDLDERYCMYDDADIESDASVKKMLFDYLWVTNIREVRIVMVKIKQTNETNHVP